AKQALEQLGRLLPTTPKELSPDDLAKQKQREQHAGQIDKLAAEQKALREESQRLAAEMDKSPSKSSADKRLAEMKQLADDALKLARQASGPDAKLAASQSAESAQQARQAM